MPPPLASLLCTTLVVWLVVRDIQKTPGVSPALWVPLIWMLIIGSRLPSEWLGGGAIVLSHADAYLEGSPIDRNIFLGLIVLGAAVLLLRPVAWSRVVSNNAAIVFFFAYTLASIAWSDFPMTAFKRWHKVLGHVIMTLVVLTDPRPREAFNALFKRCAYVLLPTSVLFIKYYPDLGRGFDYWTGAAVNMGITTNKNALGNICLVMAPFFVASVLALPKGSRVVRVDRYVHCGILMMLAWLLSMADSSAALGGTILAVAIIVALRVGAIRRCFTTLLISGVAVLVALLSFTNFKDAVILGMGEDATLTGRTELWDDLIQVEISPVVGAGFESFWLGERIVPLWQKYWWQPNQAHNGYFETYLNLGFIGLIAQFGMIVACYRQGRREMLPATAEEGDDKAGRHAQAYFKVAFLLGLLAFNLTDATFKALHPSFFVFFVIAIAYDGGGAGSDRPAQRAAGPRGSLAVGRRISQVPRHRPAAAPSSVRVR